MNVSVNILPYAYAYIQYIRKCNNTSLNNFQMLVTAYE